MTILLKVYRGWTNADEEKYDWTYAFPDSATPDEIARELFNREQGVAGSSSADFSYFLHCVTDEMKLMPGSGPWSSVGSQLTASRIIRLERH